MQLVTWIVETMGDWGSEGPFLVVGPEDSDYDDVIGAVVQAHREDTITGEDLCLSMKFRGDVSDRAMGDVLVCRLQA